MVLTRAFKQLSTEKFFTDLQQFSSNETLHFQAHFSNLKNL